jgi:uncharacterized protein
MSNARSWADRYGRWALITGAASGIGAAFAQEAARRGLCVALADRDAERARSLAAELAARHGCEVEVLAGDLLQPAFLESVAALAQTRDLGLFVHSAGMYAMGSFVDLPIEPQLHAIELHCRVGARLTHAAAAAMKARGRGAVVLVSSNSALLRAPYVANYCATKAYLVTLAEALYEELRPHGVDVLGLVPGMTDTPLLAASRPDPKRASRIMITPAAVVEAACEALGEQPVCIPTWLDRLAAGLLGAVVPRRASRYLVARSMRYYYPQLED